VACHTCSKSKKANDHISIYIGIHRTWKLLVAARAHIKVAGIAGSSHTAAADAVAADITADAILLAHFKQLQLMASSAVLHITDSKLSAMKRQEQHNREHHGTHKCAAICAVHVSNSMR
jgi:hypothetical protein